MSIRGARANKFARLHFVVLAIVLFLAQPFVSALAPVAVAATPLPISEKIREKKELLEATQRKLHESRLKLHVARFKEQTISQQLESVQYSISRVRGDLGALDSAIAQTQLRLAIRKRQLAAAQASLDRHRDALNHRVVDVYEYGSASSYLDVLLSATSFVDFIERWDFVRAILRSDSQLISTVNSEQARYETLVLGLESTQAALVREQEDELARKQELGLLADQRRSLLAIASTQRSIIAQQVYELEGLSAAEEARLQALIQEKQREDEAVTLRARYEACQARRMAAMAAGLAPPVLYGIRSGRLCVAGARTNYLALRHAGGSNYRALCAPFGHRYRCRLWHADSSSCRRSCPVSRVGMADTAMPLF